MNHSKRILASAIEAIGETPLVELSRLTCGVDGRILAKLEYLNPGFSKKDRIARQMIEDAEAQGALVPGQTVVELTSGNTGTGLAIVCGIQGYPFVAVMSKGNSMERARMMSALGAEVVLVDQLPGSEPGQVSGGDLELVERETQRIVEERNAFRANHRIQGGGYSIPDLPLLRHEHIDGYVTVTDKEAIQTARRLAKEEGIFAGFSAGANVAAALKLLDGDCRGKTTVVLLNDSGLKYLSTDLWDSR